jgi:MbtH protein
LVDLATILAAALWITERTAFTGGNMDFDENERKEQFAVLINDEEQYSLWPVTKQVPNGWRKTGKEGTKEECGAYVNTVWTDMRPLTARVGTTAQSNKH